MCSFEHKEAESCSPEADSDLDGGFQFMGVPPLSLDGLFHGKCMKMPSRNGWFGDTPILGNHQMLLKEVYGRNSIAFCREMDGNGH